MSETHANLLLVDDREENLLALEAVLEPLGHRLVSVTSGAAALKELLLDDFACILLDVQMPDLDGFQLATLIKERLRSRHIPIIFVTALSKDETQVYRGYSAGAVDYIFKPIDPDVLRSKVSVFVELWEKSRQIPAAGGPAARAGARRARAPRARSGTASSRMRCRRSCGHPIPRGRRPTSTGAGSSTRGCQRKSPAEPRMRGTWSSIRTICRLPSRSAITPCEPANRSRSSTGSAERTASIPLASRPCNPDAR